MIQQFYRVAPPACADRVCRLDCRLACSSNMRSTRRQFLATASMSALAPAQRPNVLFILADEWRAQATGYNGDTNVHAPVLDRLAARKRQTSECHLRHTGLLPVSRQPDDRPVSAAPRRLHQRRGAEAERPDAGRELSRAPATVPASSASGTSTAVPTGSTDAGWPTFRRISASDSTTGRPASAVTNTTTRSTTRATIRRRNTGRATTPSRRPPTPARFIERAGEGARSLFPDALARAAAFPLRHRARKYQALSRDAKSSCVPTCRRSSATKRRRSCAATMPTWPRSTIAWRRLLATLDRTGTADNTIVVFTSDHGDMMRSQGLTTKLHPWDESIRVPFLVRYPARLGRKGRRLRTPFNSPDIMPTLLAALRAPVPDSVEGADLLARSRPARGRLSICPCRLPRRAIRIRRVPRAAHRRATPTSGRFTVPGCFTTIRPIRIRCTTCAASRHRGLQSQLDRQLNALLKSATMSSCRRANTYGARASDTIAK